MKTSPNTTEISVSSSSNIDTLLALVRQSPKTSFNAVTASQTTESTIPTMNESTISSSEPTPSTLRQFPTTSLNLLMDIECISTWNEFSNSSNKMALSTSTSKTIPTTMPPTPSSTFRQTPNTSFSAIMASQSNEYTLTINKSTTSSSDTPTSSTFRHIAPGPSKSQSMELAIIRKPSKSRKRVAQEEEGDEGVPTKKRRGTKAKDTTDGSVTKKAVKPKKATKGKLSLEKTIVLPNRLPPEVWVVIAEFCSPKMIGSLRFLNSAIRLDIDRWRNQVTDRGIVAAFPGIPESVPGLTTEQYGNLLGSGKGCLAEGCHNKTAVKTYWSFKRRWCFDCWTAKSMRAGNAEKLMQETSIPDEDISALLATLPFGVQDSYGKFHQTLIRQLYPQETPRLYRIHLTEAVSDLIQSWNSQVGPLHVDNPRLTSQQNLTAMTARVQRHIAYTANLTTLGELNETFMKKVVDVEEAIMRSKEPKKTAMADLRDRKRAFLKLKTEEHFPKTSWDTIQRLNGFRGWMRVRTIPSKDTRFENSWKRLKGRFEQELESMESGRSITSVSRSRSTSAALQSNASTPDPTPSSTRNAVSPYHSNEDYSHVIEDAPFERFDELRTTNTVLPRYSFGTTLRPTGNVVPGFVNSTNPSSYGNSSFGDSSNPISTRNTVSGFDNGNYHIFAGYAVSGFSHRNNLRPIANAVSSFDNVNNFLSTGGALHQYYANGHNLPATVNAVSGQFSGNRNDLPNYPIHHNGSSSSRLRLPRASEMDTTFQAQPNIQGYSQTQRSFPQLFTPGPSQEPRSYGDGL